jgi:hypothetical protein
MVADRVRDGSCGSCRSWKLNMLCGRLGDELIRFPEHNALKGPVASCWTTCYVTTVCNNCL